MNAPDAYYLDAAEAVLRNLQDHDLWFPKVGATAAATWATHFQRSELTAEDLVDGVEHARAHHTQVTNARAANRSEPAEQFRPTPDTIIQHAHAARRAVLAQLPQARIDEMELANHVLQDLGYTPQQAHRFSRDVVLGRKPKLELDATATAEFQERFLAAKQSKATAIDRRRETMTAIGRLANLLAIEGKAS